MAQSRVLSVSDSCLVQSDSSELVFEVVVVDTVDGVLSALGDAPKRAVYRHLESVYGVSKDDIPWRIEDFADAIEQIFGSVAKLLEIKIIEGLHAKFTSFCYTPKKGELDFVEFVSNLRAQFRG